jgi:LysR family hydrogen peroxide-inducible transcriptional activator
LITLKQLAYALAVEEHLHFRKAAEACHVSQSALSTALAELESQLGMPLFERDNKKVLVTPMGQQVLERARPILVQVEDLYQLARHARGPLTASLSVGVIPTIGPYLLPKVLPGLKAQFPDAALQIVEAQSHELLDQLRSGRLDTAILALPYAHDGLLAFEFWQEDFYWICPQDRVHTSGDEITTRELEQAHLILLKEGHCLKDHALAVCRLGSAPINASFNATSLHTLVQLVAAGMGTTLIPAMALDQLVTDASGLMALHLKEPGPHRRIAFVCRPAFTGMASVDLLRQLFAEQMANDLKKRSN